MLVRTFLTLLLVATAASAFPGPTVGARGSLSLEIDVAEDLRVSEVPRLGRRLQAWGVDTTRRSR